jgi:hypothetical protein
LTFLEDGFGALSMCNWLWFCNMFSKIAYASGTILLMNASRATESNMLLDI